MAYYLCYGLAGTSDEQLIRVAGTRWAIEESFQTAKGQVGLDEYQVRGYRPWYRHVTLAMCVLAFLAVIAAAAAEKGALRSVRDGLVPLTIAEVRRLLAPDHHRAQHRQHPSMVTMATAAPAPRPYQPLLAQTPPTLSAAGVLL